VKIAEENIISESVALPPVVISGPYADAVAECTAKLSPLGAALSAAVDSGNALEALLRELPESALLVWIYRAPWSPTARAATLRGWIDLHLAVASVGRALGDRMLIVNADRVDPANAVLSALGLALSQPLDGIADGSRGAISSSPEPLLWARLVEWVAPEAWDVFEALEAVAWTPEGAEPVSRFMLDLPIDADIALERLWGLPIEIAARDAELDTMTARAQALGVERDEAARQRDQTARELDEARQSVSRSQDAAESLQWRLEREAHRAAEAQRELVVLREAVEREKAWRHEMSERLVASQTSQAAIALREGQLSAQLTRLTSDLEGLRGSLATVSAEKVSLSERIEAMQREQDSRRQEIDEVKQEGELLLLQLHQVQEELESYFLKTKDLERELESAKREASAAAQQASTDAAERANELSARANELAARTRERDKARAEIGPLKAALDDAKSQLAKMQTQSADQLKQLSTLRADLDRLQKEAAAAVQKASTDTAERDNELGARANELAARTKERDKARAELGSVKSSFDKAQAELDQLRADHDEQKRELDEAKQEGELLLLQLHQVQEELETYFLRTKDLEQEVRSARQRTERIQRRHPQIVDVDSVALVECDPGSPVPNAVWRLDGLSVGGSVPVPVVLRTTVEKEGAGLRLEMPPGSVVGALQGGPLVPKLLVARHPEQLERFRALGAQAWRTLVAAAAAVDEAVLSPFTLSAKTADFDPLFWQQALGPVAPLLRSLPPVFRFDAVRLKLDKPEDDSEQLGFSFDSAAFGERDISGFEVRLIAAAIQPGGFSQLPRLEFPLGPGGRLPFEGWFESGRDDTGSKLELRANLQTRAFDVASWSRLPRGSQTLVLAVIGALPGLLQARKLEGVRSSRPWAAWVQMTTTMIDVIREQLLKASKAGQDPAPVSRATEGSARTEESASVATVSASRSRTGRKSSLPAKPAVVSPTARRGPVGAQASPAPMAAPKKETRRKRSP
jgi:hypothetical protein